MSQCKETIEAGINALMKYGTGACAAQPIGGYLDIHRQLEKEIADFVGQEFVQTSGIHFSLQEAQLPTYGR